MTILHYVKKARKPIKEAGIKKGDSYYWWQFAFSHKQVSKERPARSRYMTRSETLGAIYDLEDEINAMTADDISDGCLDDIIGQINDLAEECSSRRDNMPEQLQDSGSGQILQDYVDNLESWASDLEDVDFDNTEEDSFVDDAEAEWNALDSSEQEKEVMVDWIGNRAAELLEEHKQEILDDIQSKAYPG